MELFTLNRKFLEQEVIDKFVSSIWTERYYGDSDVQLVTETTDKMTNILVPGVLLGMRDSDEIMMIESREFQKEGTTKHTGVSLMQWLNNRFIRASDKHEDRYWTLGGTPGKILSDIVYYMCIDGPFLNGATSIGITNPQRFKIPGLSIGAYDNTGSALSAGVPYGPVYDALKEIATTYEIGQQIRLISATDAAYSLQYRNYRGIDRTKNNGTSIPPVTFSDEMGALTDITELQSQADFATIVWTFAPGNPGGLATTPGNDSLVALDTSYSGFDMRALMVFAEDITTDQVAGNAATLLSILNARAKDALSNHKFVKVVDGEIVPNMQFKYGKDYYLGDLVELQGNSGTLQTVRVTEYIRTQDASGERAYPTVAVKD